MSVFDAPNPTEESDHFIAMKFRPYVWLCSDEMLMPLGVDDMISCSVFSSDMDIVEGHWGTHTLANRQITDAIVPNMDLMEVKIYGDPSKYKLSKVPMYSMVLRGDESGYTDDDNLMVVYMILFPCGWCHVKMIIDIDLLIVTRIFYEMDGWCGVSFGNSDIERPEIYITRNYMTRKKSDRRVLCFYRGTIEAKLFNPSTVKILSVDDPVYDFPGCWGDDYGLSTKDWFE